jgi:hypothetical protein
MKQILNYINGEFVATAKTFAKRAPVDNRIIGMVHEAGQAEVDAAVAAARAALKGPWAQLSVVQRVDLLYAVVDEINRRFDDFLDAEMADTGKPRSGPETPFIRRLPWERTPVAARPVSPSGIPRQPSLRHYTNVVSRNA